MKKILLFCLLGACAATVNENPDKIYVDGMAHPGYIKNISVKEASSKSSSLQRITVNGETYEDAKLFYSVVWFDADDMKINSSLSKPVMAKVRKNQPFHWSAVAPNAKAVSYKVYVADRAIEQ